MLDLKEERKYDELRKLAQQLHIPMPEAFIELEVRDKYGYVIQRHKQRSHSWTRNAYNVMFSGLAGKNVSDAAPFGAGRLNLRATDGDIIVQGSGFNTGGQSLDANTYGYRAIAGADDRGILVGSGTSAESFEDFWLETPIAEGAGGGQLNHAASEVHAISYAALTLTNTLIRYFNNNSGGNVNVNEVVNVFKTYQMPATDEFTLARDHLASTVTVPDTGQLKVTYTISLTYPS